MTGVLEKLATSVANSTVAEFIKRIFGKDPGQSDVTNQITEITDTLPDEMETIEELEESLEFLDGLEIEQEYEPATPLVGTAREQKRINSE